MSEGRPLELGCGGIVRAFEGLGEGQGSTQSEIHLK